MNRYRPFRMQFLAAVALALAAGAALAQGSLVSVQQPPRVSGRRRRKK